MPMPQEYFAASRDFDAFMADAKAALERHVARRKKNGRQVWRRKLNKGLAAGCFVAPTIIEMDSILDLKRENFGPILHVVRFRADQLGQVVEDIREIKASIFSLIQAFNF